MIVNGFSENTGVSFAKMVSTTGNMEAFDGDLELFLKGRNRRPP